jgi:hypothetical protein
MRTIGVDERRARLAVRHRLAPSARIDDDVAAIARSVVVLHATDPSTVVLSALARMAEPDVAAVQQALYADRTVVRMLGMRRTLFTVPVDLTAVVHASSSLAVAATERRKLLAILDGGRDVGVAGLAEVRGPMETWLRDVEARTLAAVTARGDALANDLSADVPELGIRIPMNQDKAYAGKIGLSSRVPFLLAVDGHLMRGHPRAGWTNGQHRWSSTATWLGAPIAELDPDEARVQLVRRWLERFGPGTAADLKWWTGWPMGEVRAALARLDTVDVDLEGALGFVLAADDAAVAPPEPWIALLPGLDPTPMGWQARDWYLGEHKPRLFDRTGNIGATVWADGRIVGGWAQRKDGEVVTRVLEDIGRAALAEVDAAAARLQTLLGAVRVTPRFPAPLDRELTA